MRQDRQGTRRGSISPSRAVEVERQVRAFNPAPGAWFEYEGERIKVLAAEISELSGAPGTVLDHGLTIACGEGAIVPSLVQRAGRGADDAGRAAARLRHSGGRDAGVTRFRLTIEYDGRPFMGWQRQAHGPSVQQAIEEAIRAITHEEVTLHAAGRTDAGVHALAMTAHVDIDKADHAAPARRRRQRQAAARCPSRSSAPRSVDEDFHARFSLHRPALRLPDRQPAGAAGAGGRAGLAGAGGARRRRDEQGRAGAGRAARFHHLPLGPLPVGEPGQDARPADRAAAGRDDRDRGGGALLPPPSGALDGRLPGAGRARQMDARRI